MNPDLLARKKRLLYILLYRYYSEGLGGNTGPYFSGSFWLPLLQRGQRWLQKGIFLTNADKRMSAESFNHGMNEQAEPLSPFPVRLALIRNASMELTSQHSGS